MHASPNRTIASPSVLQRMRLKDPLNALRMKQEGCGSFLGDVLDFECLLSSSVFAHSTPGTSGKAVAVEVLGTSQPESNNLKCPFRIRFATDYYEDNQSPMASELLNY
jgi:hypothetical protein